MRRLLNLGAAAMAMGFAGAVALHVGSAAPPPDPAPSLPDPESGKVEDGVYRNAYFDLSYPLPPGWTEAEAGPAPSEAGYYVLATLVPKGELTGTVLIAAQDRFFAARPQVDAVAIAADFRQAMSQVDGMTIDREPSEAQVGARLMQRVDFSGVGLYRAMFATEIRCHIVTFNLTTRDRDGLDRLAQSINGLSSFAQDRPGAAPACIENFAVPANLVHRVEPAAVGPTFASVPVRIIVDAVGDVTHVHVIRASAEQLVAVEDALRQWKFRRPDANGGTGEIETGVVLKFGPPR